MLADTLGAKSGDLVYVSERRAWLGGVHSTHAIVGDVTAGGAVIESGRFRVEVDPEEYMQSVFDKAASRDSD